MGVGKIEESAYKIAISMLPGMTPAMLLEIAERGMTAGDFFEMPMSDISSQFGVTPGLFPNVEKQEKLSRSLRELDFCNAHSIKVMLLTDPEYPFLLRQTQDAPLAIYVLGECDLNNEHLISVVGTRRCSSYGLNFCKHMIGELGASFPGAAVISGLAYGIDSAAHCAALDNGLPTIAVLAHGLDMVYPAQHRDLARRIIQKGGALVSEYPSGVKPYRGRFLERNRIVAGLSPLTVVVESEVKGGAMNTANTAFSYDREVYALPGRYNDMSSLGCNHLIAVNKAHIYRSLEDMTANVGWKSEVIYSRTAQPVLFPELEGDTATVYDVLCQSDLPLTVDALHYATGVQVASLLALLSELEFDGLINKLPGARYIKI